jgi:hypothetical protein
MALDPSASRGKMPAARWYSNRGSCPPRCFTAYDLIRLKREHQGEEGITYVPRKTEGTDARSRLIPWTLDTRSLIDRALSLQR